MTEEPSYKGDKGVLNEKEHQVANQQDLMLGSYLEEEIYGGNLEFEEELPPSVASSYRSNLRKKAANIDEELRQSLHDIMVLVSFVNQEETEGLEAYNDISEEELRAETVDVLQNILPQLFRWFSPEQKRELIKSLVNEGTSRDEEGLDEMIHPLYEFIGEEIEELDEWKESSSKIEKLEYKAAMFEKVVQRALEFNLSSHEITQISKGIMKSDDVEKLKTSLDDEEVREIVFEVVPELERKNEVAKIAKEFRKKDNQDMKEVLKVISDPPEKSLNDRVSTKDSGKFGYLVDLLAREGYFQSGKNSKGGLASRRVRPACLKLKEKELIEYEEEEWKLTELGEELSKRLGFLSD